MTDTRAASNGHGLELVPIRPLVEEGIDIRFPLAPGDRVIAEEGEAVTVGTPLAERYRDTILAEASLPEGQEGRPGERWIPPEPTARRGPSRSTVRGQGRPTGGELLFPWRHGWRVASGEHGEPLDAPVNGIVRELVPGVHIVVRAAGHAVRGIVALGGPTHGRLQLAAGPSGELRPGGLDVGLAGTILVVGARVDAETLTRARAMGVRGIVVAGLPSKERRDYIASEARQRAALHRLPPFAVLVLDGAVRRSIAGPVVGLLEALEGREVAIVADPPALVFDEPDLELSAPPPDFVRVRSGPDAGREGRWIASLGQRRFEDGVMLEAAQVRFAEGPAVVPIGDLERFSLGPARAQ
jgi:hypothetical protein